MIVPVTVISPPLSKDCEAQVVVQEAESDAAKEGVPWPTSTVVLQDWQLAVEYDVIEVVVACELPCSVLVTVAPFWMAVVVMILKGGGY